MSSSELTVCKNCIQEKYVAAHIEREGQIGTCSYCRESGKVVLLDTLTDRVDSVFRENYGIGEQVPVFGDDSDNPDYEMQGDSPKEILTEILETSEQIANDIFGLLSQTEWGTVRDGDVPFYDEYNNYEETQIDTSEHKGSWEYYRHTLMHSTRFITRPMEEFILTLFKDIEKYRFEGKRRVLRTMAPSKKGIYIYRARKANSLPARLKILSNPEAELSSPPPHLAPDGRMNAKGIPVFYGALEEKTALSELRLVPGEVAITGKFCLIEPIKVLDLIALKKAYRRLSYFENDFHEKASKLAFLKAFDEEISKPIPGPDENLEYVPTQALVEFLFGNPDREIDAIIFSSRQTGGSGQNIVIKKGSSGVRQGRVKSVPKDERFEEYWQEYRYSIYKKSLSKSRFAPDIVSRMDFDTEYDIGSPRLELLRNEMRIHRVVSSEYKLESSEISLDFLKDSGTKPAMF